MSKKLLVAGVMLALVATVVGGAVVANAQSVTCANIGSMLTVLGITDATKVAQANAALGCSAAVAPTTASFTRNLTVGSTGADVTALQTKLGVTPATGYFGAITKAAVVAYQTANGLPATGYVGPMTLAKLNAGAVVVAPGTPAAGCPAGMTCTPVVACPAGYTCTASNGSVSTNGVEGTITVTQSNSGLASSVYEGDSQVGVLGFKVEAKSSDMSVQRVKIDLGSSNTIYNKVLNKIYVMDGSTVLASSDLNSNTVVKESDNRYTITLTGMNTVVAKNASKTFVVAVDVKDTVDTSYRTSTYLTKTVRLYDTNAVRAVDGAGLDQFSGSNSITRNFSIAAALSESATLKTSISSASPVAGTIVAADGANQDEADMVTTLVFNVKATKSDITITDLTATTTGTAVDNGNVVTAYLYDGSTELDNASVSSTTHAAVFSNLDIIVAKDTTKTLTIKVDVRTASTSARTMVTTIDGETGIVAENVNGDVVATQSGSATGNTLTVQKAGAVYTLVGTPTLTKSVIGNTASSTFLASFTIDVAAMGADVTVASTSAFAIGIFSGNTSLGTPTVSYDKPTSGITQNPTNVGPYVIADGSSARFIVQTSFVGPNGTYTPAGAIVTARVNSATTDAGTVTYISDTFRTGSQTL